MPAAPMEEVNNVNPVAESSEKQSDDVGHISDLSSLESSRSGRISSPDGEQVAEQQVETFLHGRAHRRSSLDATRTLTTLPEVVPEVSFEIQNRVDWHQQYMELEVKFTALSMHAESLSQEFDEAMEHLVEQNERVRDLKEERLDIQHDLDVAKRQRDRLDHENKILRKRLSKANRENERVQREIEMLRSLYCSDGEDSNSESEELVQQAGAKPSKLEKLLNKKRSEEEMIDVNMDGNEDLEGEDEDDAKDDASVATFHSRFSFLSRKSLKSVSSKPSSKPSSKRLLDKDAGCSDDNSDCINDLSQNEDITDSSVTKKSSINKDDIAQAKPGKGINFGMSKSAHVRRGPAFRRYKDDLSASEHASSRTLKMDKNLSTSEHCRGQIPLSSGQCPVETLEEYTRTNSMMKWFGTKMGLDSELGEEPEKIKEMVQSQRHLFSEESTHTEVDESVLDESSVKSD